MKQALTSTQRTKNPTTTKMDNKTKWWRKRRRITWNYNTFILIAKRYFVLIKREKKTRMNLKRWNWRGKERTAYTHTNNSTSNLWYFVLSISYSLHVFWMRFGLSRSFAIAISAMHVAVGGGAFFRLPHTCTQKAKFYMKRNRESLCMSVTQLGRCECVTELEWINQFDGNTQTQTHSDSKKCYRNCENH